MVKEYVWVVKDKKVSSLHGLHGNKEAVKEERQSNETEKLNLDANT
ncbi:hypothetical protein Tco_0131718, partial [Tanacetum coccineum]